MPRRTQVGVGSCGARHFSFPQNALEVILQVGVSHFSNCFEVRSQIHLDIHGIYGILEWNCRRNTFVSAKYSSGDWMRKILCFLCAPSQQPSVHVEANAGPYTCFICTEAMGDPPVTKKFSSPLFGVPALKKRSLSIFGERKVKGRIHRAHIHGCCHGSEGKDRS